ncbi:hypothetical protein QBL07_007405 [Gordonia rubripertincta]|uniref:hypothetical protein n=1 Tax=Gordonia rubripertincta TaxID=36822 RepID=UPI0039B3E29E
MSLTKYRTATGASRWRVTWRLPDGRSRSKAFGTLREARAFEAEAITARTRGVVFDPGAATHSPSPRCTRRGWPPARM